MRSIFLILKTLFAAAVLASFAASCSARRVTGQQTSLFAHAHKAANIKLVVVDPKHPDYAHSYCWLSPSLLLHHYLLDEPQMGLRMVTQHIDLTTSRYSALTAPVENLDMGQVEEGPQARWLIRNLVHSSGTFTMAQKGDGTAEWQTHFGLPPAYIWNQDGHRVYETFSKPHGRTLIIERDLERPAYSKRMSGAAADLTITNQLLPAPGDAGCQAAAIVTSDGRLLKCGAVASLRPGQTSRRAEVLVVRLGLHVTLLHRYRLLLPAKQECIPDFAPDGRHILWTLRPNDALQSRRPYVCTYCVCDLSGRHMHTLGMMPEDWTSKAGVAQVQWLPDSRHIGFLYQNEMYTVDAQ